MSENMPEELPDPATMPEKRMDYVTVFELTDGRIVEQDNEPIFDDPNQYTLIGTAIELMEHIVKQGYSVVFPDRIILANGEESPTVQPMALAKELVKAIYERTTIRDLIGEEEIREALQQRQRDAERAARMAEHRERTQAAVVPATDEPTPAEDIQHVKYVQRPEYVDVDDEPMMDLPVILTTGDRKVIRFSAEVGQAIRQLFVNGTGHDHHHH